MRKPLFYSSARVEDMTSTNQSFDVTGESRIERVCKILSSPLSKKKASAANRTFGIPLEELVHRAPGGLDVPLIISKICEYIELHGFHHEGLFRVNGSARAIEKLRTMFDRSGDANLEDVGDVMAAAGLLKQFLRALPDAVIPDQLLWQFIKAQKEHHQNNEECIRQLKKLVEQLPEENFNVLKYLMGFLVKVADAEEYNRMNAGALGIIFGPNLFRVSGGEEGLREQAVTNQIVAKFIKDYSAIFEADAAAPVKMTYGIANNNSYLGASRATPSNVSLEQSQIKMDVEYSSDTLASHSEINAGSDQIVPKLETQSNGNGVFSVSAEDTLSLPARFSDGHDQEFLEVTICKSINKHLYGEFQLSDMHDLPRPPPRIKHKKMDLSPDGAALSKLARSNSEEAPKMDDMLIVPQSLIQRGSSHEDILGAAGPVESTVVSVKHIDHFDSNSSSKSADTLPVGFASRQDHPLTPLNIDTSHATPDLRKKDWSRLYDSEGDVSEARRSMERLQYRSTSSKNRRVPLLKTSRRSSSIEVMQNGNDDESRKENEKIKSSKSCRKQFQKRSCSMSIVESPSDPTSDDVMQDVSATNKPRLWLLDLHAAASNNQERGVDDSTSPSTACKPYIPPLDFSILHEHGDGSDPIPTNQLRASWPFTHRQQDGHDDVMLSPRTSSLEKKSSFVSDHNIPPSPPLEQEGSKKSSLKEEDSTDSSFRVLNKKISALKRKIKMFEDGFEEEYGYRPSHAEKMGRGDIKKYLSDLVKARKELKQLKEEARMVSMTNSWILATQNDNPAAEKQGDSSVAPSRWIEARQSSSSYPSMEESLDEMLQKLKEKRTSASRPEKLEEMTKEQVLEEKLAIQRSLLHFENLHGHPSTKQEKDLMKPIYERYRNVKRIAAKLSSPKMKESSMELQPIIEHQTMDFTQASPKHHSHHAEMTEALMEGSADDGIITTPNQMGISKTEAVPLPDFKKVKMKHSSQESCNLHELSHEELIEQEWKVRCEKKRLRRLLKEFEEEFQQQAGHKVQREDRSPMDAVYLEYKQVKAKLKLLEALLTKHEHHYTI